MKGNNTMNEDYISVKEFYNIINKECKGLCGINKIYDLCKKKQFPAFKMGGKYIIHKQAALEWFKKQTEKYYSY